MATNPWVDGDVVQWDTFVGVVASPRTEHPTGPGDILVPVLVLQDNTVVQHQDEYVSQVTVLVSVHFADLTAA